MENVSRRNTKVLQTNMNGDAQKITAGKVNGPTYANAKQASWCKQCWKDNKLQPLYDMVEEKGGKVLSCLDAKRILGSIYSLECENGHNWKCSGNKVVNQKQWCPDCLKTQSNDRCDSQFQRCHDIATELGGKFLSTSYTNRRTKMIWECKNQHRFYASFGSVANNGTWCKKCQVDSVCLSLEDAQSVAKSRGGKCLSTEYINLEEHLSWQCENGHVWSAKFNNIKSLGRWCPHCKWKSEDKCRKYLEDLYNTPFPNCRIKLDGKTIYLDGYSPEFQIAFEYNGRQHYEYVPLFHRNDPENLAKQQARDQMKEELCDRNGIILIVIPYRTDADNVDSDYIPNYIQRALEEIGL